MQTLRRILIALALVAALGAGGLGAQCAPPSFCLTGQQLDTLSCLICDQPGAPGVPPAGAGLPEELLELPTLESLGAEIDEIWAGHGEAEYRKALHTALAQAFLSEVAECPELGGASTAGGTICSLFSGHRSYVPSGVFGVTGRFAEATSSGGSFRRAGVSQAVREMALKLRHGRIERDVSTDGWVVKASATHALPAFIIGRLSGHFDDARLEGLLALRPATVEGLVSDVGIAGERSSKIWQRLGQFEQAIRTIRRLAEALGITPRDAADAVELLPVEGGELDPGLQTMKPERIQ